MTVYVPGARPVIEAVEALLLQVYAGLVGLASAAVAVPLSSPQVVAVAELFSVGAVDPATDTVAVAEQPLFVTVTV